MLEEEEEEEEEKKIFFGGGETRGEQVAVMAGRWRHGTAREELKSEYCKLGPPLVTHRKIIAKSDFSCDKNKAYLR
jgi:hypothetical protein